MVYRVPVSTTGGTLGVEISEARPMQFINSEQGQTFAYRNK